MPVKNYQDELLRQLRNPIEAAEYLNACYRDSEQIFLAGLRNVVEAHGGVGNIAKLTHLNRENLYRVLSENGNPKFKSLTAILECLGLDLVFSTSKRLRK
jgi:probable addiction module antidote protein